MTGPALQPFPTILSSSAVGSSWYLCRAALSGSQMSNSGVELMTIQVAWAVSGETISTVTVRAGENIRMLKEMLAEDAKTPARFMDLMFGNQVASDIDCLWAFAPRDWAAAGRLALSCLVLRKPPPRLIDLTRECFQRPFGFLRRFPSLQLSDTKLMQYIVAANGQEVNDQDDAWTEREVWSELDFGIDRWWDLDYEDYDEGCGYRHCTSLHYAAALNEVGLCNLILDHPQFHKANSVASLARNPLGFRDGWTALHVASAAGSQEVCALLLQHPKFTAIQRQNAGGLTALHVAVMCGRDDIVSTLLQGFDLSGLQLLDRRGSSAVDLVVAAMENRAVCESTCWKMLEAMAPRLDVLSWQGLAESLIHESKWAKGKVLGLLLHREKCGKLMAGAHLGNGNIDLEFLCHNDSWDAFSKEDRAHRRHLNQQKRKNSSKAQISKRLLVSQGSFSATKAAIEP